MDGWMHACMYVCMLCYVMLCNVMYVCMCVCVYVYVMLRYVP